MDVTTVVVLVFALLFVLLAARVPVAFALVAAGAAGLLLIRGVAPTSGTLANVPFAATERFTLLVIPMFILMGTFARQAGIAEETFAWIRRHTKRIPGGVAIAALGSCAGFAAISGSSVATVASVGRIAIAEMRRFGYKPSFAAGVIGAAGTLGILIPPSIMLVLYGIVTGESIGALLVAGAVPGVVSALAYGIYIVARVKRNPGLAGEGTEEPRDRASAPARNPGGEKPREASVSTAPETLTVDQIDAKATALLRVAVLFVIVFGGIYSGFFTATESSAIGAGVAGLMLLERGIRKGGLKPRMLAAFREATDISAMVFALLVGSAVFTAFLVTARVPAAFTQWAVGLQVPDAVVLLIILLAFIPLGMFLEGISLLVIAVPLTYPIVTSLGYDGIWFGILVVKMIEIGLITPPVGLNAFMVAGASDDISVPQAFRGILGFLPIDVATLALLIIFPGLVLWLPGLMG